MPNLKVLSIVFILLCITQWTFGQNHALSHLKQTNFQLKIEVKKKGTLKLVHLLDANGQAVDAELYDTRNLTQLQLQPGSIVEGRFHFESFATEGGLGTTRIAKGKGTFHFTKVEDANGNRVACPPLCEKRVKMGLLVK